MTMCQECGLPIAACNALASYRKAIQLLERKEPSRAFDMAQFAKEEYERYLAERDAVGENATGGEDGG